MKSASAALTALAKLPFYDSVTNARAPYTYATFR